MNKKFSSKTVLRLALFCGLLCAIFVSFAQFNAACDDLRTNVLRLHIIANSDSEPDQELKLKIRDKLLEDSGELFEESEDINSAVLKAEGSIEKIEQTANEVIKANGFLYSAKAEVADSYFETREYDDFTLPAGTYKSLIITLGEGEGKNWWCVVFPEICLPAATDRELGDVTRRQSAYIAENPSRYKIAFKSVEIYEDIKKLFKR